VRSVKPRCEIMVSKYLPTIRALLAVELSRKYGLTEQRIAELLGTTKAAVSQYLSSKRGSKRLKELMRMKSIVEEIRRIAEDLVKDQPEEVCMDMLCRICEALRREKKI